MPKKILIVEDDPDMAETLRLALHSAGYAIRTAVTGREALRKALISPPDLILLDLLLHGLNGFNVCERLRSHPPTAPVPIIRVSALADGLPRLGRPQSGRDEYIPR